MKITYTPDVAVAPRHFVPEQFDAADAAAVAARARALEERPLATAADLETWLRDWSELARAVWAERTRRRIAMTCDTGDARKRQALQEYESGPFAAWKALDDRLQRRYLASPLRAGLGPRYAMLDRRLESSAALFRPENVPLQARDDELGNRYAQLCGARRIPFRGRTLTPQQCAALLEESDASTRAEAYAAASAAREADGDAADALFDEMLALRQQMARNAGCADYLEYRFRELQRFDYGPAECRAFHAAVERAVVPVLAARRTAHARAIGAPSVRPWDRLVDPTGQAPLRPFADQAELIGLATRLFEAVAPVLAQEFRILVRNGLLDLMARPGKAPGGYNAEVADIRLPFVFANAVGRLADVKTLLHEGGHAFHTLATRDEPILQLSRVPIEFCEVASMSMELFGMERFTAALAPEDARRASRALLEGRLWLLAWCATIDAFQHWLYTHPGHSHAEREEAWIATRRRFEPYLDWSGVEQARAREWHVQPHLFRHALYYIEYGIALLGSVQLWRGFREDPAAAVGRYRAALRLGGSRPLPELFAAAGARFGLDETLVTQVAGDLATGLAALD